MKSTSFILEWKSSLNNFGKENMLPLRIVHTHLLSGGQYYALA
jgi:hypothetical protein